MVSAATNFGLFVELQPLFVEGLVHITELGEDYFHYDNARHCLKGERTGKVYRLGDRLKVQVAQVNLDDRKVDLRFIESLTPHIESEDVEENSDSDNDQADKKRKPRRKRNYRKKKRGSDSKKD